MLFEIVNSVDSWLIAQSSNIAVIHCKGGKGRTGTIISCSLLYSGHFDSILKAEAHFAKMRSSRELGVTQASQRRYYNI
jgi:protein-tyrosine phosphatase